jgi:hypothetical protein
MRLRQKLGYIALGIAITLIGVSIPIQSQEDPLVVTDLVVENLVVKKTLLVERLVVKDAIMIGDSINGTMIAPDTIMMMKDDKLKIGIGDGSITFHNDNESITFRITKDGINFHDNGKVIASFSRRSDKPDAYVVAKEYLTTDHESNPKPLD